MIQQAFQKFEASGNDFVLIDDRKEEISLSSKTIQQICDRRKGIGADGVIFLKKSDRADFKMKIFNSDGLEAKSCGNGLCCFFEFLKRLGFKKKCHKIELVDEIVTLSSKNGKVSVQMNPPRDIFINQKINLNGEEIIYDYVYSGVPHVIVYVPDVQEINLISLGKQLRFHPKFVPEGANVNFVQKINDEQVMARVYERGVEGETLACGTGASAIAISAHFSQKMKKFIHVHFLGGEICVSFSVRNPAQVVNLSVLGSAKSVFEGAIEIQNMENIVC